MKIENITYLEYLNLTDKSTYDYIIRFDKNFNKAIDFFEVGSFQNLSFQLVKDIQHDFSFGLSWTQLIDYFSKITGRTKKELAKERILQLSQFRCFFVKELEQINLVEAIELSHETTETEEAADLSRFEVYGYYPQFRELANNDITKIEEIGKMSYKECFTELSYRKRLSDYQKDLERIARLKSKQNG